MTEMWKKNSNTFSTTECIGITSHTLSRELVTVVFASCSLKSKQVDLQVEIYFVASTQVREIA